MNILVIAPHRDDELLGVGGTILKRKATGDRVAVCIVTAKEGREWGSLTKTVHAEMEAAFQMCGIDQYYGLRFEPVTLEYVNRSELNGAIHEVIVNFQPDEIYIPYWGDMQKDHQIVAEAIMVAARSKYNLPVKRIYAYETLSETGIHFPTTDKTFIPNVYVDISDCLQRKLEALKCYRSQMNEFPDLRSIEAVEALAKIRGAMVNINAAEAFMLIREIR